MKDIKGYEGLYAITSCGRVWSHRNGRFLNLSTKSNGYQQVTLRKHGVTKNLYVHRLVADAYKENPYNFPEVNHKDENKSHNWVGNLEFVTHKENMHYGSCQSKRAASRMRPVYCVELDRVFASRRSAATELGILEEKISACIKGKRKTCGGYHWKDC